MNKELNRQQLQDRDSYKYLLRRYQWELTLTCRIPTTIESHLAHEQLVLQVLKPLSAKLKQKIGAISVVVPTHYDRGERKPAHIHSLLLSYEGTLVEKTEDIQEFLANSLQPDTMLNDLASCWIKPIDDATYFRNTTNYLSENLVSVDDATLNHFKKKLLLKRMVQR